jgi:hypothetical protein
MIHQSKGQDNQEHWPARQLFRDNGWPSYDQCSVFKKNDGEMV